MWDICFLVLVSAAVIVSIVVYYISSTMPQAAATRIIVVFNFSLELGAIKRSSAMKSLF